MTEDNELTIALKSLGAQMCSPLQCRVTTELMPSLHALWRQRMRWERGALENIGAYGFTGGTTTYWLQQLGIGYGTIALNSYLLLVGLIVFATRSLHFEPFWTLIGLIFVVERVVTVWGAGWRGRLSRCHWSSRLGTTWCCKPSTSSRCSTSPPAAGRGGLRPERGGNAMSHRLDPSPPPDSTPVGWHVTAPGTPTVVLAGVMTPTIPLFPTRRGFRLCRVRRTQHAVLRRVSGGEPCPGTASVKLAGALHRIRIERHRSQCRRRRPVGMVAPLARVGPVTSRIEGIPAGHRVSRGRPRHPRCFGVGRGGG